VQFGLLENESTPLPHPHRDVAEQLGHEPRHVRADLLGREIRPHQADAAVDIVPHAAGRDHTSCRPRKHPMQSVAAPPLKWQALRWQAS